MEESTKKIFKPKFELVQECNGLVSIHLGKHAAAAILQGTEITGTTQEDHQMLVVCRTILRDIALNALGVRPEELCQDKARNLYIIYQIAYVVYSNLSSRGMFISRKRAASFFLSILVLYLSSTQNITWKILLT
jgi:hypothetical protein